MFKHQSKTFVIHGAVHTYKLHQTIVIVNTFVHRCRVGRPNSYINRRLECVVVVVVFLRAQAYNIICMPCCDTETNGAACIQCARRRRVIIPRRTVSDEECLHHFVSSSKLQYTSIGIFPNTLVEKDKLFRNLVRLQPQVKFLC